MIYSVVSKIFESFSDIGPCCSRICSQYEQFITHVANGFQSMLEILGVAEVLSASVGIDAIVQQNLLGVRGVFPGLAHLDPTLD